MRDTSQYRIDGQRVPSVTEVLKLAGFEVFRTPAVIAAGHRGHDVHEWCDLMDSGDITQQDAPDEDIAGYVEAYLRWQRETGVHVLASEQTVISQEYRYAGTLDRVVLMTASRRPGEPIVIDLKCVAAVSPETRLQLVGYALAAGIKRRASVQLRRDGKYRLLEYEKESDVHDWLACVRLAHFKLFHRLATLID